MPEPSGFAKPPMLQAGATGHRHSCGYALKAEGESELRKSCVMSLLLMLFATLAAAPAFADCDTNFSRQGTFPYAQKFSSRIDIPGLTPEIAFSQLRTILAENRVRILSEDRTGGVMAAELPPAPFYPRQTFEILFQRNGVFGSVTLTNSLRPDVLASGNSMRDRICGMLNRLTDPYGRSAPMLYPHAPPATTIARQADSQTVATASVPKLALTPIETLDAGPRRSSAIAQIDTSNLARQVALARANPARIQTQFVGKEYRLSGKVIGIIENYRGYAIKFEGITIPVNEEGQPSETMLLLVCQVPKAKAAAAASLNLGQRGTLQGRFFRLENHSSMPVIAFEDCQG